MTTQVKINNKINNNFKFNRLQNLYSLKIRLIINNLIVNKMIQSIKAKKNKTNKIIFYNNKILK